MVNCDYRRTPCDALNGSRVYSITGVRTVADVLARNDTLFRYHSATFFRVGVNGFAFDLRYVFCVHVRWLQGLDLNQRPLAYETSELPDCSTLRLN